MHDPCISNKEEEAHHTHCLLQGDDVSECNEESRSETESEVSTAPTECTMEPEDG